MMNNIKYLLLLVVLLLSSSIYAQSKFTISGFVQDSLSTELVVGASIISGPKNGTITNEFGFFSIIVDTPHVELTVSQLGYKTKHYKIKIDEDLELKILLASSAIMIGEVSVVTENSKFAATKALGAISVNSQQLKYVPSFMGEKDIIKYFQLLPGVQSGREGTSGLNIRGGSADQTLILMDDTPIYNSTHAFGFVSIFSGEYIKSAELYKGYIPPQYGGRLSGVAKMNIRDGSRKEHNQSIQLGTTTFSALVEGPINNGKGSYLVGGRYFIPDLLLKGAALLTSNENSTYPQVGFYDITAKVSYDISKNSTIYGSFYTGRDAIKFISNDTDIDAAGDKLVSHTKSGLDWGNIVGSIRLSSKLSNKSFFNVTTYYSHLSNKKVTDYNDSSKKVLDSKTKSKMDEIGLKATMLHNINSWYNLSYGVNLSYQYFMPQDISMDRNGVVTNTKYGDRELYTGNIFVDNKFRLGNFSLNIAGRISVYNNNKEHKIVVEPRTALTYYMEKSSIWASYVVNSQPLFSMNQQLFSLPLDYWIPFRRADELPMSKQYSLGYRRSFDFGLELQSEAYYKSSKNISIVYNSSDFMLEDGGYKLATGDAYGVELLAQYSRNRFNVMASYTYSKSIHHIDNQSVDFMYDTPHDVNILASYEVLRRGAKVHTFSTNINYKTGLPYILSNEKYPMNDPFEHWFGNLVNYPIYANTRLTNFFRVDLNYSMEKKLKNGSRIWQISLLNATAHRNPYLIYYKDGGYKAFQLIPFLPSFSYTRKF